MAYLKSNSWTIPNEFFPHEFADKRKCASDNPDYFSESLRQSAKTGLLKSRLCRPVVKALFRYIQASLYPDCVTGCGSAYSDSGSVTVGEYQLVQYFGAVETEEQKKSFNDARIACVIYSNTTGNAGKLYAGVVNSNGKDTPGTYAADHDDDVENDQAPFIYAMLPHLMKNSEELSKCVQTLVNTFKGWDKSNKEGVDSPERSAFVQNMFVANSVISAVQLAQKGAVVSETEKQAKMLNRTQIASGNYAVFDENGMTFRVFTSGNATSGNPTKGKTISQVRGMFAIPGVTYTDEEKRMIPVLPEDTVIPQEAVDIARLIRDSSTMKHPNRNFILFGPSGLGKTTISQIVAVLLGMPYDIQGCNPDMDALDMVQQVVPNEFNPNAGKMSFSFENIPSAMDIAMDPAGAYEEITGKEKEDATERDCFEAIARMSNMASQNAANMPRVRYEKSPLLKSISKPYMIEVQEPSTLSKPGAVTVLNSLMDGCGWITLPSGERVFRDPNAIVFMTTNLGYEGTKAMNQSVLSRCRKVHIKYPEKDEEVANFLLRVTEIRDFEKLKNMARVFRELRNLCAERGITQGSCGYRELIDWCNEAYLRDMELRNSFERTMAISAAIDSDDDMKDIMNRCAKLIRDDS